MRFDRRPIPMTSSVTLGDMINGCRTRYTRLGYVTTTEPKTHRISYETASWYTDVEVPAGRYEVVLGEGYGGKWVLVRYVGTITDEHFVNRLLTSSSVVPKRNIGKESACSAQCDLSSAAERFATDPAWTLVEDYGVSMSQTDRYRDTRSKYGRDRAPHKFYKLAPLN